MTNLINQIAVFFILMLVGVIVKKLRLVTDDFMKGLSNMVVYISLPAMLITSMNYDFAPELLTNSILILCLGGLTHAILLLLAIVMGRARKLEKPASGIFK